MTSSGCPVNQALDSMEPRLIEFKPFLCDNPGIYSDYKVIVINYNTLNFSNQDNRRIIQSNFPSSIYFFHNNF